MNKYHKYKDSGIQWIGKIPEHWEVKNFAYQFLFSRGLPITKQDLRDEGIPCVNYGEIHSKYGFVVDPSKNKLRCVNNDFLTSSEKSLLERGDFVFADTSEDIDGSGNFTCLDSDVPTFAGYHTVIVRQKGWDNYKYLAYFFDSIGFRNQIRSEVSGIKVFSITHAILKKTKLLLPPLKEQTQIAHYLDKKTKEIDELIAAKKKLLQLYEEEKTAIINQAVTKGINPNVPMKDSGIEWLGEIPAHWEVKKLKYIADIILGKMLTSENKGGYFLKPYLRAANLGWLTVNIEDVKNMWFSEKEIKKYRVEKNDLLVSEGGEVGRTCIWKEELTECYIQNSVHRVVLNNNCISKYFLHAFYLFGQKGVFDFLVNRISIAHLTVEKLKDVQFSVPPKVEQNQIVKYIETEITEIDTKKERTKNLINLLSEYRTTLISEVVTGKINVIA